MAVAARDRDRAEAFSVGRGVERVHDTYGDVLADPEVELVYNALVNSEHARWNVAALEAGKHVLSEKPLSSNAAESRRVQAAAAGRTVVEGFHYLHHPVHRRLAELVTSGALGDIERVDVSLQITAPPSQDPRWSEELAGGATMDLGCYVLNAARQVARWLGTGEPSVHDVTARLRTPTVDSAMTAQLRYAEGMVGTVAWDMDAAERSMVWTVTGSTGSATAPHFGVPHLDNRLAVTRDGRTHTEVLGDQTSYTYQLAALTSTLRDGAPFLVPDGDAVANAELIDACYRAAGLPLRGAA